MRKIISLICILSAIFVAGCSGDSAYDLAVDNGFNGSVEDYLESLKGDDSNITIYDIFDILVDCGEYNKDEFTLFLKDYLGKLDEDDSSIVMNNSLCSTVSIEVTFGNILKSTYYGSGVIYKLFDNGDAYIITNHHVVTNPFDIDEISKDIKVYIYGYEYNTNYYEAQYVGSLLSNDISVIKVNFDLNFNAKYVKEAKIYEDRIYPGDMIYAIGNPMGEGLSITQGIISVDSEIIETNYTVRVMRIDAAVNGGNSGGPLFNKDGLLIGIIDAKVVDVEIEGICYALPISAVSNIADNIIKNNSDAVLVDIGFGYKTYSSSLYYDIESKKYYIKEIIVISKLDVTSPLYKEGLRVGDQLTSIVLNSKTYSIERDFTLDDILFGCSKYDEITINTYRVDFQEICSYKIIL